jgi:hypothetical protein
MTYKVKLVYEEKGWPIALRDYPIKHRQLVIGTIDLVLNIFLGPRETVGEVGASSLQSRTKNYHVWDQASANTTPLRSPICGVSQYGNYRRDYKECRCDYKAPCCLYQFLFHQLIMPL